MKALTADNVTSAVGTLLTSTEVRALLARRDKIVDFFEREAKTKGAENVFFS
jgi:hypothetical protein